MKNALYLVTILTLILITGCTSGSSGSDDYTIPLPDSGIGYAEEGNNGNILYIGNMVLPTGIYKGEMLIGSDGIILYIGRNSGSVAGSENATRLICAYGLAVPGFIDGWRQLPYAGNEPFDTNAEDYEHRHDWRLGLRGHIQIPVTGGMPPLWDELTLAMAGTTSYYGNPGSSTSGMIRCLYSSALSEDLFTGSHVAHSDTFPLGDASGHLSTTPGDYPSFPDFSDIETNKDVYAVVISEGIDNEARNEFLTLSDDTWANVMSPKTMVIHGIGLKAEDLSIMADAGTGLVWTPRSDLYLYGNTAEVTTFNNLNGNIVLGSTWNATGSLNTLLELKTAHHYNNTYLNGHFSDLELIQMATINGARAYKVDHLIGSIEVGKIADITIFDTKDKTNYDAIFTAEQEHIALVMRGGVPLYGDMDLIDALRKETQNAEIVTTNARLKRIYTIGEWGASNTISDLLAQVDVSLLYDDDTIYKNIVPARDGEYTGIISPDDLDGDGIANDNDNAPYFFNPIRPIDGGSQGDHDNDGIGDVADLTPVN